MEADVWHFRGIISGVLMPARPEQRGGGLDCLPMA